MLARATTEYKGMGNLQKHLVTALLSALTAGGGVHFFLGPGDAGRDDLSTRVAVLESKIGTVGADIAEIKGDIKTILSRR